MAVSGTCTAFSTSFPLFCLFRFGCGMALSGLGLNTFSLSMLIGSNQCKRLNNESQIKELHDDLRVSFCVIECDSFISSCGMDPHSCANWCGHPHRLLLHTGTAAPGSHSLLHSGLEVVNLDCVFALLCLLPLLLVRCEWLKKTINMKMLKLQRFSKERYRYCTK